MQRQLVIGLYMAAGLLILPGVASAQSQAYTNSGANLRAGPASDYPIVAQLPGGVPVTVMGCLRNYQWCDVATPNLRGWVYASRLSSPYQGYNMPLNYGAALGLPILAFSINDYWGNYYRGQPWYGQRSRWARHAPPPPPRPGAGHPPPNWRPLPGHVGGRPPGGSPPGHAGGRPPGIEGGRPPGNAGGRPPGGPPPGSAGGRPPGAQQGGGGGRPPGGGPQGGGGGRPPGGAQQGGGNRPPGGQGGPQGGHQDGPQGGPQGGGGGGTRPPGGGGNN
ncbi:SH3 domain-containing protein [Paraburkholderia youngii]|uniref:SH3 domain-containing protein n=1 Tax=Paraburkholderia youngii TaxID=2782701 RepID=UPI003D2192CA